MEDHSAAASSTSGSPRDATAGSGSDRATSQSDLLGAKREGSDEPDDERDQLDDEDSKSQPDSGSRTESTAPVVEALVAMHSTGTKNANAQFVHKLFAMVQTPSLSKLIAWAPNGLSFSVYNPTEFSKSVLPMFFKHNNFQSFVRQLNMYGFHKVNDMIGNVLGGSDGVIAWEFQHAAFQRDRPELLTRIKRKSSKAAASTPAPPTPPALHPLTRKTGHTSSSTSTRTSSGSKDRSAPNEDGYPREPARANGVAVPDTGYFERPTPIARASGTFHRGKSERDSPRHRSPPTLGPAPGAYGAPGPAHVSPRNSPYSLSSAPYPGPPSSYQGRPSTAADEGLARQVAGLDAQVRTLSEALHSTQQENYAGRIATYSVMRLLLGVIERMDLGDARKEELQRCQAAIAQLNPPQLSPNSILPPGSSGGPFAYSPFTSSAPWQPYASSASAGPRGSISSASASSQFYYQRPAPAESFARGASGPSRKESREEGSSPFTTGFNPLPTPVSAPSAFGGSTSYASRGEDVSSSHGYAGRPTSSGFLSASQNYPSPRTSWQGSHNGSRPAESGSTTTLPPISALFGGGEGMPLRRTAGGGEAEEGEEGEEARKKLRRS